MSLQKNTTFNFDLNYKSIGSLVAGAALFFSDGSNIKLENTTIANNYIEHVDYSSRNKTTSEDSIIKNDIEMLKTLEISKYSSIIKNKFGFIVNQFWVPADKILDESCLFLKLENHDSVIEKYNGDLELDIYLAMENELKNSKFFNMVALY